MPARRSELVLLAAAALLACSAQTLADDAISLAEQRLFLDDHFAGLPPAITLQYAYTRTGSLTQPLSDSARLDIKPSSTGTGRLVSIDFMSGPQRLELPAIDTATANPIVLYFLERDVREMQRATGGQAAYFRKRVRLALAEAAEIRDVAIELNGKSVAAEEIIIDPYRDDPLRQRFKQLAYKTYRFVLSRSVPGDVYQLQTIVRGDATGDAPVLSEETLSLVTDPSKEKP